MKRSEVKINETWDVSAIYETEEIYNSEVERLEEIVSNFEDKYKGKLNDFEALDAAMKDYIEIREISSKAGSYASLPTSADAFDEEAENRYLDLIKIMTINNSKLTFFQNELVNLDLEILEKAKEVEEYRVFIEDVLLTKEHILSNEVEEVLTKLSPVTNFPYKLYEETKFKDIKFDDFAVNGKNYELSYNLFEGHYEYEKDKDVRREAFKKFSETIDKYKNTTANAYVTQVRKEKIISELRGYETVFDYLLDRQKVSMDLYNRQIDVIVSEFAPHMRKYASILKRIHKLDEIRYSDLKIDIDPEYSKKVSFEEAQNYILDGLSILGEDYLEIMKDAFDNRWIDYANNEGKSTGAFCASPYKTNSFILMTFNNNMSDTMTLAHELGHAGHFQLTHENQSILNSGPSMYFVEAPSTTNELIVENYLLEVAEKNQDKRMKRWVLSQMVAKTYYHNFVTHLLEAAYQREVYNRVDNYESVTAELLNEIKRGVIEKFWGDDVDITEGAELTWMRQPHYYMGLYPYTYSAGLTIATEMSQRILNEGQPAVDEWLEVLKTGGKETPVDLAKMAGIDITTDAPLKNTIKYIGELVDELETLTEEIEG